MIIHVNIMRNMIKNIRAELGEAELFSNHQKFSSSVVTLFSHTYHSLRLIIPNQWSLKRICRGHQMIGWFVCVSVFVDLLPHFWWISIRLDTHDRIKIDQSDQHLLFEYCWANGMICLNMPINLWNSCTEFQKKTLSWAASFSIDWMDLMDVAVL